MTLATVWLCLLYVMYLLWVVQGARLLAMLVTGEWDESPPERDRSSGKRRRRNPFWRRRRD